MPFSALPPVLSAALSARGYTAPTPVQAAVIEDDAQGRDLIVSAQTGSGKTVAFGLAMATVLPEPVWADTIRSRPCASSSMTAAWTGVGAV